MNEIKTIGIVGSGKMGSDLFNYLSDFNFQLIWFTRNIEHQNTLKNTFQKKIKRQLKHGIISKEIFDLKANYKITNDIDDFSACDLIIESVIEDLDVKVELFHKLEKIVKPSCVLASNSSSVLPSEIAEELNGKNRIIGIHFFYPIAFKNIVEVVQSRFTDDITIEKAKIFLNEIKRFHILQNEETAFILNRFLLQIQIRAFELKQKRELDFKQIDTIGKSMITEFGLFEVMDHVGHNTMYNAILNYSRMDTDKNKYKPLLDELQSRKLRSQNRMFIDTQDETVKINPKLEREIKDELKDLAEDYMNRYTTEYGFNIYNLKKGLEEFCGILTSTLF